MKTSLFIMSVCLVSSALAALAGQKDPRTRDEDISGITVSVKIERPGNGIYRYVYTLKSPQNTIGIARRFALDVFCENLPETGPQRNVGRPGVPFNLTRDGRHLPVTVQVLDDSIFSAGIDSANAASARVTATPSSTKIVAITAGAKPGYRKFLLTPDYAEHEHEYNYAGIDETDQDDLSVPSSWDFEVHGVIPGPACVGQEANPTTRPVLGGQRMLDETRQTDTLLSYEIKGNRNRFHVPAGTSSLNLKVYYRYDIDPATFKATLNGDDISALFQPDGGQQDVVIPLTATRNLLRLSAYPVNAKDSRGIFIRGLHDIDPFEVRRD